MSQILRMFAVVALVVVAAVLATDRERMHPVLRAILRSAPRPASSVQGQTPNVSPQRKLAAFALVVLAVIIAVTI